MIRGHFASADEAIAAAWRAFQQPPPRQGVSKPVEGPAEPHDPLLGSIGAMEEDAGLLDEIVADVYRRREANLRV